jgi:hypothetical protein
MAPKFLLWKHCNRSAAYGILDIQNNRQTHDERIQQKYFLRWSAAYFKIGSSYRHFSVMLQHHMARETAHGAGGRLETLCELVIKNMGRAMTRCGFMPVDHVFVARVTYVFLMRCA